MSDPKIDYEREKLVEFHFDDGEVLEIEGHRIGKSEEFQWWELADEYVLKVNMQKVKYVYQKNILQDSEK